MAIALLESSGIPTEHLRSKSWEEFATAGAPEIDIVITVCDSVAGEVCPIWPGHPVTAHWGIEDPAAVVGDGERRAFESPLCYLPNRITLLLALPIEELDALALKARFRAFGQSVWATEAARSEEGWVGEERVRQ